MRAVKLRHCSAALVLTIQLSVIAAWMCFADPAHGGFLITEHQFRTALPGIFAAGAVRSGYGGLLVHAMAEGISAAKDARAFLR